MAITPMIDVGFPTVMTQNTVFALPSSRCILFTTDTAATVQQSNDPAFAANVPVAFTNGQQEVAGPFIRCTSGNITVTVKKF